MVIPDLDKPDNAWCQHCEVGEGCRIYDRRPRMCRDFFCGYIVNTALDERWHPSIAHFILRANGENLVVQVDPQRPDAWKREPYHSALREHARVRCTQGGLIIVKIGGRKVLMLPYNDLELGAGAEQDAITIRPVLTSAGPRWEAVKPGGEIVKIDQPRLPTLHRRQDGLADRTAWDAFAGLLR